MTSVSNWSNIYSSSLIAALIILVITYVIASIASKVISRHVLTFPAKLTKKEREKYTAGEETKLRMIRRLIVAATYFVGTSVALFQFEGMEKLGTALFASAGVLGLVAGMAAQSTLANVVAGLTISFSQPVRLGDFVEIDKEFGQVEEMTLMHTIIKTWDNRRLVIPNKHLANTSVRNYTLSDPKTLVQVEIYLSYESNLEKIRKIISEESKKSPYWDKITEPTLQITELAKDFMRLKALIMVGDSSKVQAASSEVRQGILKRFQEEEITFLG